MPEIGWIDGLRRWNAGGTSWCIPRKGTPGYNTVMRIRRGEPTSVKEHVRVMERKEKRSMQMSLTEPMPTARVEPIPMPSLLTRTIRPPVEEAPTESVVSIPMSEPEPAPRTTRSAPAPEPEPEPARKPKKERRKMVINLAEPSPPPEPTPPPPKKERRRVKASVPKEE